MLNMQVIEQHTLRMYQCQCTWWAIMTSLFKQIPSDFFAESALLMCGELSIVFKILEMANWQKSSLAILQIFHACLLLLRSYFVLAANDRKTIIL